LRPQNAIGSSSAMLKVYEQIANACDSDSHILIRGEAGSGKDFAMHVIANSAKWRSRPLQILDCSTMQDSLIEAELFGSYPSKKGLVETVQDGIVYLDSIGLIGQALQLKLLKYLTDKTYRQQNGQKDLKANARIIASTSGDLETRMKEGTIRPDFYYQMSLFTIMIPPLRERRRDIPALAKFFMQKHAHLHEKKILSINQVAMNMLKTYHWPTNVRELENCIERAVIISAGQSISVSDLPPSLQTAQSTNTSRFADDENVDFQKLVEDFERDIIVDVLTANRGNASATARRLAISRRILNYKIDKLGIKTKAFKHSKTR
jgi:Nif-specific regulatory protein